MLCSVSDHLSFLLKICWSLHSILGGAWSVHLLTQAWITQRQQPPGPLGHTYGLYPGWDLLLWHFRLLFIDSSPEKYPESALAPWPCVSLDHFFLPPGGSQAALDLMLGCLWLVCDSVGCRSQLKMPAAKVWFWKACSFVVAYCWVSWWG